MKSYTLEREQWIPAELPGVFAFFSDAANLAEITPPWMGFRIRMPLPVQMQSGLLLEYTIRLAGIPVRWRTRITDWDPPRGFSDVQERGPYAVWEHAHRFRAMDGGVPMTDRVRYALPLGLLGRVAHRLAVRATLHSIFDYRMHRIRELFG